MSETVTLRLLETMDDFVEVVALQQLVWQKQPQDTVSAYVMQSVSHNGGAVIGAEIGGRLVGFTFCFVAKRDDPVTLWSHISGVHPHHQGKGIGFLLKQRQRNWALEHGHTAIAWTFDPLQRGNANFNFNHLGVTVSAYHVNLYGEMKDGINTGLATDRLEAIWELRRPKVVALIEGALPECSEEIFPDAAFWVRWEGETLHQALDMPVTSPICIEIPWDIAQVKQADLPAAVAWQQAVRLAMQQAIAQGYTVSEFVQRDCRCWYVPRLRNQTTL